MKLLLEALELSVDTETPPVSLFCKLMELREQASGEEADRIASLIEAFINQAPPELVVKLSKVSLRA